MLAFFHDYALWFRISTHHVGAERHMQVVEIAFRGEESRRQHIRGIRLDNVRHTEADVRVAEQDLLSAQESLGRAVESLRRSKERLRQEMQSSGQLTPWNPIGGQTNSCVASKHM